MYIQHFETQKDSKNYMPRRINCLIPIYLNEATKCQWPFRGSSMRVELTIQPVIPSDFGPRVNCKAGGPVSVGLLSRRRDRNDLLTISTCIAKAACASRAAMAITK